MNRFFKKTAALIFTAAMLANISGCYFFPDEDEILDPPTIDVAEVVYSTYTAKVKQLVAQTVVSGYLVSKTEEECFFTKYTEQLKTIYVRAGDLVEEGDLIAEMNNGAIGYMLETQKLRVELAQLNYNNSGSAADKLALQIEQNTLAQYQDEYDGGRVYAPISGQVSYVSGISPGTYVDPYQTLVKIVDPEDLCVSATITNNVYTVGDKVTVRIGEDTYDGIVSRTPREEMEDGDSVKDQLFVDFTGEVPSFAYIGSISDVVLVTGVSENAVTIPKHLVKTDDSGRVYVQVLRDGEKVEVDITTGISNATEIEVLTGLSEGDQVVVK